MIVPYDKKQSNSLLSIKGVDPNNHIDTSQKISLINPNLDIRDFDVTDNKKKLKIELSKEKIYSKNVPEEEKEKYLEIQNKTRLYDYYSFETVEENNFHMNKYSEEHEMSMENKVTLNLPEELDFDVEFYKFGKRCNGLKKRYGIIKRNGFYSSKKPLERVDKKKLKDKTEYLLDSEVITQRKDEIGKEEGEWSNKNKIYRIRINYIREKKENNPKFSSFFFYFDNKEIMMKVYYMLYGLSLNKNYKLRAKRSLVDVKLHLHRENKFYVILKILTVKQKIKIRKNIINKVNNAIHGEMLNKLYPNVVKSLKKYAFIRRYKPYKDVFSDFMPLISKISPISKIKDNKYNQRSKNELILKYKELEKEIPQEIVDKNAELLDVGICLNIPNGVIIDKKGNAKDENFKLNTNNSRYIFFDRNKHEIIFKNNNNDNIEEDNNILSHINIYEISNVILNSNINVNDIEDNNLIIIGPKINNNIGITYKYKDENILYEDPEIMNIKRKTFSKKNNNKIDGTILQIFHSELDVNQLGINKFKKNQTESVKEDFLFGYRLRLSEFKSMDGKYILPKLSKDNIYFIEYNHQYFIPEEYFNKDSKLIIELFCLPIHSFSKKDIDNIQKENIGKLLSPINYGYIEVEFNDLINKRYKYLVKDSGINKSNSFFIISGGEDQMDSNKLKLMEGKVYSIGDEAYIEAIINKKFIDQAKENLYIPEEIKDKYFNVNFEEDDFLFRPNEEMSEEEFRKDISSQLSEEQIQKIFENKKYNYLPYCVKYTSKKEEEINNKSYINKSNIYDDPNLNGLTKEAKDSIINDNEANEGKWIYKASDLKVKLLSKNLGVKSTGDKNEINQLIYSNGERKLFPVESLNKGRENSIILISENNFNIFDMKEINMIRNLDNFKWKTGIKFNDSLQMKTFLKLLILERQKINTKMKNNNDYYDEIDIDKFLKFDEKGNNQCEINVEFIYFRQDFQIDINILPTYLYFLISQNNLLSYFKNPEYGFQNQLLKNQKISKILRTSEENANLKGQGHKSFKKKVKINKNNINQKKIYLNQNMKNDFNINREYKTQKYYLNIEIKKFGFYYSSFDLNEIDNSQRCNKLELPIKKINDERIYGCVGIDLMEKNESGHDFEKRFNELNKDYLKLPLLVLKEYSDNKNIQLENYHFGLYEPNVFRRKILNFIHDKNIDPKNIDENDPNNLKDELLKKCVDLSHFDSFSNFNYNDLKINFDSYKKKLGLKLLKIKRHEEFMKIFRESEWDIYMNKIKDINKGRDFSKISKSSLIKENNDVNTFHNLIYLGIHPEYRKNIYRKILKIDELVIKTKVELEKLGNNFDNDKDNDNTIEQKVCKHFFDQVSKKQNEKNLIFSLIDNDCIFLYSLADITFDNINAIKKIAKAFFYWTELKIGLSKNIEKYVYFFGILSIIEKLRRCFEEEDWLVFWLLIGLSQYIDHFSQQNPLFTDEMNYINVYGLVTKLILEQYFKEIYDKFISLNFPIEFFISRHLSTLFTDYFNDELMMRILDIIIFESSFKGKFNDKLHYLRILCSIPITLFELSKKRILACESVSEIESIFNNLISHNFNNNKFIFALEKNVNKFFISPDFFTNLFYKQNIQEWDNKRGDIEDLNYKLFHSVYEENNKYLNKIKESPNIYENYFHDDKLKPIKEFYFKQDDSSNEDQDMRTGIILRVSKLQQFYNNDNNKNQEYKLIIFFYDKKEFDLNFINQNNKIKNTNELYIKKEFQKYHFPEKIHFELKDNNKLLGTFIYLIKNHEFMKLSKIVLENRESNNKYFLEFLFLKYTHKELKEKDFALFNYIFSRPEYLHSTSIEESLYSYSISNNSFKVKMSKLIKERNERNNDKSNLIKLYKKYNNTEEDEDKYNIKKEKNLNNILSQTIKILNINEESYIKEWLNNTNTSIEEILYSLILIDKSFFSINEKLLNLFSIAQAKDKIIFESDKLSIEKLKELIYSLYKRYMIYFTKTEVERMIDFLLKDERLFNIKYAFVYNEKGKEKINEFIYDKDRYVPRLDKKNDFEICYDNIDKQLNIILNHLNNHYNMKSISKEILQFILETIINKNDLTKYEKNNFNRITLVIERDNLIYERNFTIVYSPLKVEEEPSFDFKQKNEEEIIDHEFQRISDFDINNSYSVDNFISFYKFREIFFKMPYLSDLFRVSFSYSNEKKSVELKPFENLKVTISYETNNENQEEDMNIINNNNNNNNKIFGVFYFPKIKEGDNEGNNIYEINSQINSFDTVDKIINQIINYLKSKNIKNDKILMLNNLKNTDEIICYVCYYLNEEQIENEETNKKSEKIGFFDGLCSCTELDNKKYVEIEIKFKPDLFSYNLISDGLIEREKGYCKIFYNNNNDFIWKKCYVKSNKKNAKLINVDYETQPILNNRDIILAYDL